MASAIELIAREIANLPKNIPASKLPRLIMKLRKAVKATEDTEDADKYRSAAKELYADGSNDAIEVDDDAVVSKGDDKGAFVAAWVWVPDSNINR
jgi:hypothetical protein